MTSFQRVFKFWKEKEVRGSNIWAVGWVRQGCNTIFHQEVGNNERGVDPRIVVMQDPRGGDSWSDTDDAFSRSFEYLNVKSSSDNILTLIRRSVFNNFFTRATLSSVFEVEGRPERSASSLPSRKTLCRLNAVDLLVALFP